MPRSLKKSSIVECLRATLEDGVWMIANVSTPAEPLSIVSSNNGPPGRRFNHGDAQLATMRETPHREASASRRPFQPA